MDVTLKALLVDDEYPARQELRYLLGQLSNVEVVGEAASASEAMKLISALEYDILFLDISLPGMNGLELASKIRSLPRKPHVIFITAYENYALEAFDVNAADYILKPIEKERLQRAIDKVAAIKNGGEARVPAPAVPAAGAQQGMGRIVAKSGDRITLVDVSDICFVYVQGDSVYLKTATDKLLTRLTLKELEGKLGSKNFFRTHRSFIVNIRKVREIRPFFNGTCRLVMDDREKSEVPVSRNQTKKLRKLFS
jgi:DNA-binding LytR/AlgR family response regulator